MGRIERARGSCTRSSFVAAVEIAPFDENAAREFGRISMLAARGTPIGEFDG